MKHKQQNRKGMVMLELCLVMAIAAIVVAMTVSFGMIIDQRVSAARARYNALESLNNAQVAIESWITRYDNVDYEFESDDTHLYINNSTTKERVGTSGLNDDKTALVGTENGKTVFTYATDALESITFSAQKSEKALGGSGRVLIACVVQYHLPSDKDFRTEETKTQRFTYTTYANTQFTRRAKK